MALHPLLSRQLKRAGIDPRALDGGAADVAGAACGSVQAAALKRLLQGVSRAYEDHDQENYLLERSQEMASQEMAALSAKVRADHDLLDRTGTIGGVGGWQMDLEAHTLEWTDQAYRILDLDPGRDPRGAANRSGAARQALTFDEMSGYYAPEARPIIRRAVDDALAGAGGWDLELPMVTAKGRAIWVRVIGAVEFANGRPVRMAGAVQDITARRAMEADLQRSEQLLRGAIDAIDQAFVLYGPDDRLVFCNDRFRMMFGTAGEPIVPGVSFEQVIRKGAERGLYTAALGRIDQWVAERIEAYRSGKTSLVELSDGRSLRVVERNLPDGHHVGFRIDITDLIRATEAAEEGSRAKSEFIATISHELRTPLQSILGFSDLGRHFAEEQPQFEEMFGDIHAGGQRMLALVNGLLDLSKIYSTLNSIELCRRDLVPLVREVVRELRPIAAQRGLRIELPEPLPSLPANVDPIRIQQVIRNVLANALRFAPDGSAIEIGVAEIGAGAIEVAVRDHGPGIPPEELEKVFEAFVQSTRTRDGSGGTGLGLTICRKIIDAHGGSIIAGNAASGSGALMRIRLPPLAPAHQHSGAAPAGPTGPTEPSGPMALELAAAPELRRSRNGEAAVTSCEPNVHIAVPAM